MQSAAPPACRDYPAPFGSIFKQGLLRLSKRCSDRSADRRTQTTVQACRGGDLAFDAVADARYLRAQDSISPWAAAIWMSQAMDTSHLITASLLRQREVAAQPCTTVCMWERGGQARTNTDPDALLLHALHKFVRIQALHPAVQSKQVTTSDHSMANTLHTGTTVVCYSCSLQLHPVVQVDEWRA